MREPAFISNGLAEIIRLVIPVLILFGLVNWTGEQVAGIMALVSFVATFVATLFTRTNTVSVPTANDQIVEALKSSPSVTVKEIVEKVEAKNATE